MAMGRSVIQSTTLGHTVLVAFYRTTQMASHRTILIWLRILGWNTLDWSTLAAQARVVVVVIVATVLHPSPMVDKQTNSPKWKRRVKNDGERDQITAEGDDLGDSLSRECPTLVELFIIHISQ